jgi:proteasome lid subunit RPN8/RPN11
VTLTITRSMRERVIGNCRSRRPIEACGVLAGPAGGDRPVRMIPLLNACMSDSLFAFDPDEQLRVWQGLDAIGERVVAVYHSHPATPAVPSTTDIAYAADPGLHYVIVGLAGGEPEFRSWRVSGGAAEEEDVAVIDG